MPRPLSPLPKLLLTLHALLNLTQGLYTLISPRSYATSIGPMMAGASDKAVGAIGIHLHISIPHPEPRSNTTAPTGLGALAVGYYQLIFVYQGNRTLVAATIPLRLGFAGVMWWWGEMGGLAYELGVAVVAGLAVVGV